MKRALLAALLLLVTLAAAYAWSATRRERSYRQYIEQGEAALSRDDTFSAIEAFSGAIALKGESMLGYLKRGEAYRRRGELEAKPTRYKLCSKPDCKKKVKEHGLCEEHFTAWKKARKKNQGAAAAA